MRFCKKCQVETERTKGGKCKPCRKAYGVAYRAANPEKVKATKASYRAENAEKVKSANVAWRAANPEKTRAAAAAYRAKNLEKAREWTAAWSANNRESKRIHEHNRRARKKENGGKLSKNLAARLYKLQRGKCACCKLPLGDDYHLDHIMPLALGGSNTDDNIQLLRASCNLSKHTKHPISFMRERGFLL